MSAGSDNAGDLWRQQMEGVTFQMEPGWTGAFTRNEADGAIPNGSRVVKVLGDPGDATAIGTEGVVLGSIPGTPEATAEAKRHVPTMPNVEVKHFYFIEWDGRPRTAIGCADWKVAKA